MTETMRDEASRSHFARKPRWCSGAGLVAALALALVFAGGVPPGSLSGPVHWLTSSPAAAAQGCQPPSGWQSTKAVSVPDVASDRDLTSFDGTVIRIHWFPDPSAGGAARPTVLMGPGWGSSGDTDTAQAGIQGALSIAQLWQSGFNVLTWDPRGFGRSGGAAEVDSPNHEGRDVSAMINWVARQPGVELERAGVPRIGMVGESYGGGIQFAAAERDCRIDAIAPTIAWHSLGTSLDKNQTPKEGWGNILAGVSASAKLDPEITATDHEMASTGVIDGQGVSFFEARGPAQFLSRVKVPTLILQGTVDDLFTLDEGIANYETLRSQGTTVSMAWFCGGHGVCLTDPGTAVEVGPLSLAWMQRYVAGDSSAHVLKGFTFVDQDGTTYASSHYPLPPGAPIVASGAGSLALKAGGGSGPPTVAANAKAANVVDSVAYPVTPGPAANAVNIAVPVARAAVVVGAPTLSLTYSGTAGPGTRPTRVFAQLVDPAKRIVLNNQITPVPVTLDGRTHTLTVPLESVGYTTKAGAPLELQLVATTTAYITPRLGGTIEFSRVAVKLPTVKGFSVVQEG
ncbi:MAG TPA: alpha/beta fold hydrolase [Acidimicrobiales bacterium]|nr:alpha/beta fold hydrolase [Acidimicrobiales bacterium]